LQINQFRMLGGGYQAMLFQIPEQHCMYLFLLYRPITKPAPQEPLRVASQVVPPTKEIATKPVPEEPSRVASQVVPPTKEMAEMSLQEQPPVHKTGTSGKQ
jgi:hypothetical protein